MDEPDFKNLRVAIVGLGLMGGSLALALRDQVAELIGCEIDSAARQFALDNHFVSRVTADLGEAATADLIILATPPRVIIQQLREFQTASRQPPAAIVIDLGSTKSAIVAEMQRLPASFDPIGGHPMCGKEVSGLANAGENLFRDQTFILTPLARTSPRALNLAQQLIALLGAHPLLLPPDLHDHYVALISHLPYLAASALMRTALKDPAALTLAASGFRDTTRLAASDLTMMTDILTTNREAVLNALQLYRGEIDSLLHLVSTADAATWRETLQPMQHKRREMFTGR